jgi:hypothetical protein
VILLGSKILGVPSHWEEVPDSKKKIQHFCFGEGLCERCKPGRDPDWSGWIAAKRVADGELGIVTVPPSGAIVLQALVGSKQTLRGLDVQICRRTASPTSAVTAIRMGIDDKFLPLAFPLRATLHARYGPAAVDHITAMIRAGQQAEGQR